MYTLLRVDPMHFDKWVVKCKICGKEQKMNGGSGTTTNLNAHQKGHQEELTAASKKHAQEGRKSFYEDVHMGMHAALLYYIAKGRTSVAAV